MATRISPPTLRVGPLAWGFGAVLLVTIGGFWPSFFSNPLSNDTVHIVHGLAATGWILLLITQSLLITARRGRLHMAIGRWSPLLVMILLGAALLMVHSMMLAHYATPELRLTLAASDLFGLVLFAALYGAALVFRCTRSLHSRLMGSTVLVGVPPAVGRLLPFSFNTSLDLSYVAVEVALLALIANDARRGHLRWSFPALLGAFAVIHWALWQAPHWDWFRVVARVLGFPG